MADFEKEMRRTQLESYCVQYQILKAVLFSAAVLIFMSFLMLAYWCWIEHTHPE